MKKAFTLLELIFVIIVIAILTAVIIPNTHRDPLREAAVQLISDIRYTQHLSIIDDKFDIDDLTWYKKRWQLLFGKSHSGSKNSGGYYAYTIFSDTSKTGNPDPNEIAKNPLDNSKLLSGGFSGTLDWKDKRATENMNIGYKYTIINISTNGCGGAKRIAFDYLGRPLKGNSKNWTSAVSGVLTNQCRFILQSENESVTIAIEPETGYAHIL